MMLGLPPEIEYQHVSEAVITLGVLIGLLLGLGAAHLGHLKTVASALGGVVVVAGLGTTVVRTHRRYRHVGAGALVLAALLGLLGGAVYHRGHLETLAAAVGPTAAALADSVASR